MVSVTGRAHKLRVEYPAAVYRVTNRGEWREPIFRDHGDRERFIGTLDEACAVSSWHVHALCLMGNQFQLLVARLRGNIVAGMKRLSGIYTGRLNRWHKLFGDLSAVVTRP